jgi:hypothetical protein
MKQTTEPEGFTPYPDNWPRCPACGDYALDGHITCGRVGCDEAGQRALQRGAEPFWMQDVRIAQRAIERSRRSQDSEGES